MGIPFYYKHIVTKYKSILKDSVPVCHRLYLDYNSIIHQCAGSVVKENPKCTHDDIISKVLSETLKLIQLVNPLELVYIGIDGVAPRAKMVQQRKRRYITSYKNDLIKDACERMMLPSPPDWDSNIITPGTSFMSKLDQHLKEYFQSKTTLTCEVVISGSNEKGEGEQKLFDHLRAQPIDERVNIINGLDADLIMLSLLSDHTIYLRRDEHCYVDIPQFRDSIAKHVDPQESDRGLMYDYVFMCFLLGNDFLPNIPFLKIRNKAADVLLDIYRKVKGDGTIGNLVKISETDDIRFRPNMTFLKEMFKHLADMEKENMEFAVKQYNDTELMRNYLPDVPNDCPKDLKRFLVELEQYPLKHRHALTSETKKDVPWMMRYYHDLFGSHEPDLIKAYCNKYLDGLTWVLNYYFNRKFDYFWYFKYSVAPLSTDIYKILLTDTHSDHVKRLQNDSEQIDISPELQLLCVIPKRSLKVLPNDIQQIMTDPEHACIHYFPQDFRLCTFMKKFLWECVPLLPDIDICHLHKMLTKSRL